MTRLNNHVLLRTANAKATTIFVACSTLLITLGVATIMEGSNHILYQIAKCTIKRFRRLKRRAKNSGIRRGITE
jgi:hypothetical protein